MASIELADVLGITRNLMASTSALVPKEAHKVCVSKVAPQEKDGLSISDVPRVPLYLGVPSLYVAPPLVAAPEPCNWLAISCISSTSRHTY